MYTSLYMHHVDMDHCYVWCSSNIVYVLLFPEWISLRGPAAQLPFTIALCAAWDRRIVSLTAQASQRWQHHAHTTRMLTLCADLHHLIFHVSQILITSPTPCYSHCSDGCPTTLYFSIPLPFYIPLFSVVHSHAYSHYHTANRNIYMYSKNCSWTTAANFSSYKTYFVITEYFSTPLQYISWLAW